MFVLIEEVFDYENGRKSVSLKRSRYPAVKCVELKNRRCFYKIEAVAGRGVLPYEKIEVLCGKYCKKVVLPENTKGIEKTAIEAYRSESFLERMLLKGVPEVLKKEKMKNLKFTVIDKKGILCDLAESLMPFTDRLSVVTDFPQAYEDTERFFLMKYGLSVMVRKDFTKENLGSDVVISFREEDIPICYTGTVFSLRKGKNLAEMTYFPKDISLPACYENLTGENTNRLSFAAALYELCDVKETEEERILYERYPK